MLKKFLAINSVNSTIYQGDWSTPRRIQGLLLGEQGGLKVSKLLELKKKLSNGSTHNQTEKTTNLKLELKTVVSILRY